MFRKRWFWIVLIVFLLLAAGGYVAYTNGVLPWLSPQEAAEEEPTLQTATVTVGDLSITADGTGVLVPSSEVKLAFGSAGTLMELLAEVGDQVEAGEVLAWIDDTDARKAVVDAELSVLQAEEALENAQDTAQLEQTLSQAELKLAQAEADLAAAQTDLDELLDWAPDEAEIEIAQANLAIAQGDYQVVVAKANMRDDQIASARINLEQAIRELDEAQADYANAQDAARDWERNIDTTRENATKNLQKAQDSLAVAQANYNLAMVDSSAIDVENARVKVLNAEQSLEDLQTPPEDQETTEAQLKVQELEVAFQQARLDLADAQQALAQADTREAELALEQARLKLESAQKNLEGATITAPVSGTVVEVNAEVGETVNGTAIVLANLRSPVVQFWVEESDLNSVAVGHPVRIVFEALPDVTYEGKITRVDPVLVTVGNTPAVQAWANIDTGAHPVKLLGDMNVEVEVVAGEALNALLVPVQALRELGENQYAVFVVQPNGELEMRLVEVGLMDYVNAEVRSGLQRGEVVSTGERASSSSSQPSMDSNPPPPGGGPAGGGMMRFFGG